MKTVIVTRALSPDVIRASLNFCTVIAVNNAFIDNPDIRIFMDWFNWRQYLDYPEKLVTTITALSGDMDHPPIPKKYQDRFLYFRATLTPCTDDTGELYVFPSTLGAALDLAYKIGTTELLLIADNKVNEDGNDFMPGFCNQAKDITNFYNTKLNLYQFSDGNFDLPVMSIEDFTKG